jgi:nitric oxide synthase-interacting protein
MSKASKHAHTQPFMRASELKELGSHYGTASVRMSKDSQRAWNACCLTLEELNPGDEAVATPEGFLFSRQALLENMLAQKKRYKAQLKAWREHEAGERAAEQAASRRRERDDERRFADQQEGTAAKRVKAEEGAPGKDGEVAGYFRPDKTGAAAAAPGKPAKGARCPMSGSLLKLEELQRVAMARQCAACRSVFAAGGRIACLVPSGLLLCADCLAACGDRPVHPVSGEACRALPLKRGGTGFAANTDDAVVATQKRQGFQLG